MQPRQRFNLRGMRWRYWQKYKSGLGKPGQGLPAANENVTGPPSRQGVLDGNLPYGRSADINLVAVVEEQAAGLV